MSPWGFTAERMTETHTQSWASVKIKRYGRNMVRDWEGESDCGRVREKCIPLEVAFFLIPHFHVKLKRWLSQSCFLPWETQWERNRKKKKKNFPRRWWSLTSAPPLPQNSGCHSNSIRAQRGETFLLFLTLSWLFWTLPICYPGGGGIAHADRKYWLAVN